jgi:hypothetical protein
MGCRSSKAPAAAASKTLLPEAKTKEDRKHEVVDLTQTSDGKVANGDVIDSTAVDQLHVEEETKQEIQPEKLEVLETRSEKAELYQQEEPKPEGIVEVPVMTQGGQTTSTSPLIPEMKLEGASCVEDPKAKEKAEDEIQVDIVEDAQRKEKEEGGLEVSEATQTGQNVVASAIIGGASDDEAKGDDEPKPATQNVSVEGKLEDPTTTDAGNIVVETSVVKTNGWCSCN